MVYRKLQASSGAQWHEGIKWCYCVPLYQFPINHQPFDYTPYSCLLARLLLLPQPTWDSYPIPGSSGTMGAVANDVVKHVWIGRANTMDEMIEQCKEPGGGHTLHLLQGARARMMGLHVLGDERATGSRCRTSEMSLTVNPSGITATRLWP